MRSSAYIYIYIYITACGFTAESAILHSCYYDIVTAAITESVMFAVYITACGFTAESATTQLLL